MPYEDLPIPAESDDLDPTDETDNVPETEPEVEEEDPLDEVMPRDMPESLPEQAKFEKLYAAAQEITESRVAHQLARMVQAGVVTRRESWDTPRRYQIQTECVERCKDREMLANQWGTLRFLRRDCLGNPNNELAILISWTLLGMIAVEAMDWELGQLKDLHVPEGQ